MALRYSFDEGAEADRLEQDVNQVLADGLRTTPTCWAKRGYEPGRRPFPDGRLRSSAALEREPLSHSHVTKPAALRGPFSFAPFCGDPFV